MKDLLSVQKIKEYLNENTKNMNIEIYPVLSSTNTVLKEKAAGGAPEGTVVIAEKQTMGRGRFGRSFFSPENTGIYMSILLRPKLSLSDSTLITCAAAVAVSQAIEENTQKQTFIKWINDIWIEKTAEKISNNPDNQSVRNFAKICGILTEASFSAQSSINAASENSDDNSENICDTAKNIYYPDYVVLGIGINIFEPEGGFPENLSSIAATAISAQNTSLFGSVSSTDMATLSAACRKSEKYSINSDSLRSHIIASVLNKFMYFYPELTKRTFLDEYRARSIVIGKKISVIRNTAADAAAVAATAVAIDDNCNLLVEFEDGTKETLYSGEISIKLT